MKALADSASIARVRARIMFVGGWILRVRVLTSLLQQSSVGWGVMSDGWHNGYYVCVADGWLLG